MFYNTSTAHVKIFETQFLEILLETITQIQNVTYAFKEAINILRRTKRGGSWDLSLDIYVHFNAETLTTDFGLQEILELNLHT